MNININELLEKYWSAESSLQEEAQLRAYFSGTDVADEHLQYKELFSFFSKGRLESTDLDVEQILTNISDIDTLLNKYWNAETSLEDEAQLKAYFSGSDIDPKHEEYKSLFTFYELGHAQESNLDLEKIFTAEKNIDDLLEKYWNAETSLKEEEQLKQYFAGDKVEDRHESYKQQFGMYAVKSKMTSDIDVAELLSGVENTEEDNKQDATTRQIGGSRIISLRKWAAAIAAVFVLGFAAVSIMNEPVSETQYKGHATILDEEAEAQEAYEITKEALAFLSKKMNTGSKTVVESVSKAKSAKVFK